MFVTQFVLFLTDLADAEQASGVSQNLAPYTKNLHTIFQNLGDSARSGTVTQLSFAHGLIQFHSLGYLAEKR